MFRLVGQDLQAFTGTAARAEERPPPPPPVPVVPAEGEGLLEIPYAVRWLVPRGERFANFDILNDNDTQLEYYRRFGHIYAVGIPSKKWRLVVVSDPELLDEVAEDGEQFGKRVEEINFFAQLAHSRGGGISVIGDGAHYEQVSRVMLPWYSPQHQRTQLERMKDQARKLVAAWAALPAGEPLDARAWMERYTLEVSGRGACAYDFGLLEGGGDPHPFAAAVPASTKESIARVAEPHPDFTMLAGRARRARKKAYRAHNAELFRTADALVRGRSHTAPLGQQTDLLSRRLRVRLRLAADARRRPRRLHRCHHRAWVAAARARRGSPARPGNDRTLPPRPVGLTPGVSMDALALVLTLAAMVMFVFAASGRELRRFNELALGLVFLAAALICQFTSITNTHIGR
jgi:hypothetical protein